MIIEKHVNDLENLFNLHGEVFPMDNGYRVKFEVYQVEVSKFISHRVRYSLALSHLRSIVLKKSHLIIFTKHEYSCL